MPTYRALRSSIILELKERLDAATIDGATIDNLMTWAATLALVERVAKFDAFTADAEAMLGAATAAELEDALQDFDAFTAYYTALNVAETRNDLLTNAVARAAIAGSGKAITGLSSDAFAQFYQNATMGALINASASARAAIVGSQNLRDAVFSVYNNAAVAVASTDMLAAIFADATARTQMFANTSERALRALLASAPGKTQAAADPTAWAALKASVALTSYSLPTLESTDAALTTSSANESDLAWKASDSNPSGTYWQSGAGGVPYWIKYDFGGTLRINLHTLVVRSSSTNRANAFTLEGSNDNSAWTSVRTGNLAAVSTEQTFDVLSPLGFRYYRLSLTSMHDLTAVRIADFDLIGFDVQVF